jgi:hypothetical protein
MFRAMRAILQALQVVGITSLFPAIEALRADVKVRTSKRSIIVVGMATVKPSDSLPGSFRQSSWDARQASYHQYHTAVDTNGAAIITFFHETLSVTYLSQRDHQLLTRQTLMYLPQ